MILNFDCRDGMRLYPDNYFDSIVTDPPYELGFMGRKWDASGIAFNVEVWREALRVLKPGGHLLAFSGTRTQHRMVCAIEDAGFDIRDQIGWAYGSGFPKSLDVSKAIDAAAGAERTERLAPKAGHENFVGRDNLVGLRDGTLGTGEGGYARPWMNDPEKVEDSHWTFAPATAAAAEWQGWGTALKPAWEPICVARKPLIGTVAANVLAHGTGSLNIDGCRVGMSDEDRAFILKTARPNSAGLEHIGAVMNRPSNPTVNVHAAGRWPANLIHDGSDEVLAAFPETHTHSTGKGAAKTDGKNKVFGKFAEEAVGRSYPSNSGSAARFFYCAKASKSDRGEGNNHPTVKPTDLMRYLCRLVTPPGGLVLDPFAGSGSTGKGAALEGFAFIGFDLSAEYCAIGNARIDAVRK